jgi:hypothetical protein
MNTHARKTTHRRQDGTISSLPAAPELASRTTSSAASEEDSSPQPNSIVSHSAAFIEPEQRQAMIAEAAYYRAERRGFEPGHEIDDWCAAEGEIDGMLTRGEIPLGCGV